MKHLTAMALMGTLAAAGFSREFHVSPRGNDRKDGSVSTPLATISAAARLAQPGDVITVHEGTYRERVTPPQGGESDVKRIVYQAAPGEKAVIKGSEVIRDWKQFAPGVWKATLPNSIFGKYNPYKDLIAGRIVSRPEPRRSTPYHKAHSTALAGLDSTTGGDNRGQQILVLGRIDLVMTAGQHRHRAAADAGAMGRLINAARQTRGDDKTGVAEIARQLACEFKPGAGSVAGADDRDHRPH